MADWKTVFTQLVYDAESQYDRLRYRLLDRLGGLDQIKILPFNGFGNRQRLYLKGRVLEDQGIDPAMDNDSLWTNLSNMYKRMESNEVPHARILARFQGEEQEVQANDEGYFEVTVEPSSPLPNDRLWHTIELELLDPEPREGSGPVRARGEVFVPQSRSDFVVVSDIDDTIVKTEATQLLKMARNVFLGNARTRLPFPGVAALYRALYHGATGENWNPMFYVSSSPWNLYDLLVDFFNLQNIPVGPVLFLRDWGIKENEILPVRHKEYKYKTILKILESYPEQPFILIGDSGQEDPEIYARIVSSHPGRVLAVYIRNVSRDLERAEEVQTLAKEVMAAGSDLILAADTVEIAKHAIAKGWIREDRLPEIMGEKVKDQAPPSTIERLVGEEEKEDGVTAVISTDSPEQVDEVTDAVDAGALQDLVKNAGDTKGQKPPTVIFHNPQDPKKDGE